MAAAESRPHLPNGARKITSDRAIFVRVRKPLITWAEVTLDYCDTERAASFWSAVLGLPARTQTQAGWFQLGPAVPGGPVLNIQPVTEAKVGKSRVHLDFWVDDVDRAVALVEQLGAREQSKLTLSTSGSFV